MQENISTFLTEKSILFKHPVLDLELLLKEASLKLQNYRLVEVQIEVQVDYLKYLLIDQHQVFHLENDKKNMNGENYFEQDKAISLQLILDTAFLGSVADFQAEGFVETLTELSQRQTTHELLNAQNWYALNVKQEVEIPKEIATDGKLQMGYSTTWYDEKFSESLPTSVLFRDIFNFFKAAFPHAQVEETNKSFSFVFQDQENIWKCELVLREQYQQILLYSYFPYSLVDKEKALHKITEINYDLPVGNFEMDEQSGEIRFKTYLDFGQQQINASMLQNLFDANVYAMGKFIIDLEGL